MDAPPRPDPRLYVVTDGSGVTLPLETLQAQAGDAIKFGIDFRIVRWHAERRRGWRGFLDKLAGRSPLMVVDEISFD
jgi:hypothetical protein